VYRLRADTAIVNTVDFFPPLVDDPFDYGRIAAANAMSDVFAMGGRPITVMNLLSVPVDRIAADVVAEILKGGAERAHAAGAVVVGGHTVADDELMYGMAVTGTVHPDRFVRNRGARRGDVLVLTKPLGTGIIATAIRKRAAEPAEERAAIASMVALNAAAGAALVRHGARACTDVTGFGLAGHAAEMASASVRLEFEAEALPLLPGTAHLAEAGHVTGGSRRIRDWLGRRLSIDRNVLPPVVEAVIDPQTSGGLLVSLPASAAAGYVAHLHRKSVRAAVVGRVAARPAGSAVLVSVE
jgi:selenide,water dikinase